MYKHIFIKLTSLEYLIDRSVRKTEKGEHGLIPLPMILIRINKKIDDVIKDYQSFYSIIKIRFDLFNSIIRQNHLLFFLSGLI
jgi:hypothetical protein